MWYFSWILGVLLALAFGIINVLWYEAEQHQQSIADTSSRDSLPAANLH
ncbi:MAG: cytochrome bd-I oxidase subunit CydX [Gammaproteobacteria bacterium]|nr:MAG: cytochrome bd-I oxidase subunit CydX [Gammaproteobacteria bacterium]